MAYSSFWKPFQVQYHLSEISYRNFLTNGKRPRIRVEVAPVNYGKTLKKDTSFGERIHWFRVEERPIRV